MRFHFAGIWKFNIAVVERRLQCDVIKWVISAVYIANGTLLKCYSLLVCAALEELMETLKQAAFVLMCFCCFPS